MRFTIDSQVLMQDGITLQEFAILLYYISGGVGTLNESLCNTLWNKGFLIKDVEGYLLDNNKISQIESWTIRSSLPESTTAMRNLFDIAKAMQDEFPKGKKEGTSQYWKDSTKVITQRLSKFIEKYGSYSKEDFVNAAKNYVASFNGNYSYMQLLKYFIYKKDIKTGEENSQLASFLDNKDQQDMDKDWTSNLI